jgi:hypothetical protein
MSLLVRPATTQIAPGDLVVLRIGDGTGALTNASMPVFLDEYTTAGSLVGTIAMPTSAGGSNLPLTNSGTATSEGHLNLSSDGQYLVSAGYGAVPGTGSIAASLSTTVPRVIARVDLLGNVDTSTALTDAFSGNNFRSAASDNGNEFWMAGTGSVGTAGIRYVASLGATTSLQINPNVPTNNRVVNIFFGQLYCCSSSGTSIGVSAVGGGLPTAAPQNVTLLPGFPTTAGPSNYDFFLADLNTLYVTDDRTNGAGGIQKWTQSGGTWTLQYTLAPSATVGCRGVTGIVNGGIATLYATTTQVSANQIVTVVDAGPTSPVNVIATASTNEVFRGIRLTPTHGSIVRVPNGCGQQTINAIGVPTPGGAVTTTLSNYTGLPFIGLGLFLGNTPICSGCFLGHEWAIAIFGATSVLNVPNTPVFNGISVGVQGADLLGVGGCVSPPVTLSDTMIVTIG